MQAACEDRTGAGVAAEAEEAAEVEEAVLASNDFGERNVEAGGQAAKAVEAGEQAAKAAEVEETGPSCRRATLERMEEERQDDGDV